MQGFWTRLATHNAPFFASALRKLADEIELLWPGSPRVAFPLVFWKGGQPSMGEITVKDNDGDFGGTVSFLDAKGAPTSPDDVPTWSSDDENVVTVTASDDGLSGTLTPGMPGAAVISVHSVETDDDGNQTEVLAQGTVTVQPSDAVIGSVEFTPPA